jgi:N4-gp56 family major capsid protein
MGAYNSDPSVYTLANSLAQDADAKGKVYTKAFELSGNTADDFAHMEGNPGGTSGIWVRKDLKLQGADRIKFTSLGEPAGPGVRGEAELTGNTSTPRIGGWTLDVDFWRDAVELSKKQIQFLAAGGKLEYEVYKLLGTKFGRQKQADMMMALIRQANGNVYRVGNRATSNDILAVDKFNTATVVQAQARARALGARPVGITKSKSGSELQRYIAFAVQDAMTEIRNSSAYITALQNAAVRADENPTFSGKLLDWNGIGLWEHTVVQPDADDWMGSPLAPMAKLGVAITDTTAAFDIQSSSTNTKNLYYGFFPGYDWKWTEGQTAAPDSATYYAWIIPQSGAQQGKAMFVSYVGTGNNGNKITITNRLHDSTAAAGVETLGGITFSASHHATEAPIGSIIIPANSKGTPLGRSLLLGAGSAIRAYGAIEMQKIQESRDYGFITGFGYMGIFGQSATKDTQGLTRNYVLIEHAIDRPGIVIPGTYGV